MDIKDVRTKYPQYKDISDLELADALYNKYYSDDLDQLEFYGKLGIADQVGNELTRGAKRGYENTKALITEGVPAVLQGLSNEHLGTSYDVDENLKAYQQKTQDAQTQFPTKVPSFRDIDSIGKGGAYVASAIGEQVPQLGASLLGGGLVGVAAKQGVSTLAKRAGTTLTKKQLDKAMQKGILGGTLSVSATQNVPESYFNILEQGKDEPTAAILTGGLKTGLDVIPQIKILERIMGPRAADIVGDTLLKRATSAVVTTGIQEGLTESAQEGLDILAEKAILDLDIYTPENIDRLIDAGLKGVVGGSVVAAGASPLEGGFDASSKEPFDESRLTPKQVSKLDEQFTPEKVGTADNVLQPLYYDSAKLDEFASRGVNTESLSLVVPEDLKTTEEALNRLTDPTVTSLNNLIPQQETNTKDLEGLLVRSAALKEQNRNDTDFYIGDGEIVFGAPIDTNPTPTLTDVTTNIKVSDINALEMSVATPLAEGGASQILPNSLAIKPSPKYRNTPLVFANDVDRAIYGATTKRKDAQEYYNWVKENVEMTDKELQAAGEEMRSFIRKGNPEEGGTNINIPPSKLHTPKLQRTSLPNYGNVQQDLVMPSLVSNELSAVNLTPKALEQHAPILKQMERVLKEVAGSKARLQPLARLSTGKMLNEPVAGAQYLNTVALALNTTTMANVDETMYHEAWHFLEKSGVFTDAELASIDAQTDKLVDYMNQDGYLRDQDFHALRSTKEGREELRANAFGKWAKERAKIHDKTLPNIFGKYFRKAKNFLNKFGNTLRGMAYNGLEDVFQSTLDGQRSVNEILDNVNYTNRVARLQRLSSEYRDVVHKDRELVPFQDIVKEARIDTNTSTASKNKQIGLYTRYLRSAKDFAHKSHIFAVFYNTIERQQLDNQNLLADFIDSLGATQSLDKAFRYRTMDFIADLNKHGSDFKRGDNGEIIYTKGRDIYRMSDPAVIDTYDKMQRSFRLVLDENVKILTDQYEKSLKAYLPENYSARDIDRLVEGGANLGMSETQVAEMKAFKELLESVTKMKKKPFIPRMRFGSWGITVRDKVSGEQIAFYTVEKGEFNKLYSKFQLKKVTDELSAKYSDTSKYEVVGGNGPIKDFSNIDKVVPFKMDMNSLANGIDPRFLNNELLSSMLSSNDFDTAAYESLKDKINKDILVRGFKNRFEESEKLDGYSEDWDRVIHSYFSGAAQHLSSLKYQPERAALEKQRVKLDDDKLKEKIKSYMDYNTSPSEDYLKLRSFNFLWTMGANLSTAALQVMTLPTTTLGSMTQYNPNILQNMKYIGKWFAISKEFFPTLMKTVQTHNGILYADFRNESVIKDLIDRGKMDEAQAKFLYKMSSQIRGFQTEEYSGFKPFETRSLGGSVKGKLSTAANTLGLPISTMEQITRFATAMASFDMFHSNPKAVERANKLLANDQLYQVQKKTIGAYSDAEMLARFSTDEAHAVFGKVGRPEFQRGIGGALFVPFMTYPQQALEFIIRSGSNRGVGGKAGALTALGALYMFSGLLGLPGAELIKELYEEVEKEVTGSEEDLDFLIREKIYEKTGSVKAGKFVTQGIGRAFGDLDVARRVGLPIPGQDLLLNLLGIRGETSDALGVSGSVLSAAANAWNQYSTGAPPVTVLAAMAPVAPSNVIKALSMREQGVSTNKGQQLLTPEEVTLRTQLAKAVGITTDQIATEREEAFAKIIADRKYTPAIDKFRARAKRLSYAIVRARQKEDWDTVREKQSEYKELMEEFGKYAIMNGITPDFAAFSRSIVKDTNQKLDPTVKMKDIRKLGRESFFKTQAGIGADK